ncbi:MAG: hypothetical protein CM1200mP13_03950 [Candidatus Pelagibacterales bacterium]|nr:MAG: hypothetical protein CM1200mP13_03950 [Pelagibacterales bacterium]
MGFNKKTRTRLELGQMDIFIKENSKKCLEGIGTLTFPDGSTYEGEWAKVL